MRQINVRVSDLVYTILTKRAEEELRSVTNYAARVITSHAIDESETMDDL